MPAPLAAMSTGLLAASESQAALLSFAIYLGFVFLIAVLANRAQRGKAFAGEYFLGSRSFGVWAFALTYAATAASGGSFMGFPALIYAHGWSLAWWISGFMLTALVALGLFAKRINQVSRIAGAITVPELLRKRFDSPRVGVTATAIVIFFMFFYLLAQFKAGAEIMATLLEEVDVYRAAAHHLDAFTDSWFWIGEADGSYLLCLLCFAVSVIVYTTYGGFRAVVWTDVMQGIVMAIGVVIMLVLALSQVGGLSKATDAIEAMTPPEFGEGKIHRSEPLEEARHLRQGTWIAGTQGELVRLAEDLHLAPDEAQSPLVSVLLLTTPAEIEAMREQVETGVEIEIHSTEAYAHGAGERGVYLTAPGPHRGNPQGFLPVFLALSFFAFWNFSAAGQPSYMVRQMAFRDTRVLRHSILFVSIFFTLIYFPLVLVFTSARVLLPGMEIHADRVMPEMAALLTANAGVPWLAGLLVAAPFAAVMSSVDSFLLLVSSGIVRDIYQQHVNPDASEKTVSRLSHASTVVVGLLALIFVLNPPAFLQTLIVFASGGLGACFLVPMALALYWPRMTANGAVAGMITGGLSMLAFYLAGWMVHDKFAEYNLLGIHPFIWSTLLNLGVVVGVSSRGPAPDEQLLERYFGKPS